MDERESTHRIAEQSTGDRAGSRTEIDETRTVEAIKPEDTKTPSPSESQGEDEPRQLKPDGR